MLELDPRLYTVAWITPLEIEAKAALHMLDHQHVGRFPMHQGDDYIFQAGDLKGHNVIIATLPAGQEYGTGSAAALAAQVKKFFPNLWFGLLVGVAAGLPNLERNPPRDIRLGDVLVGLPEGDSAGLIAVDLGKETKDGLQLLRHGKVLATTETVVRSAIGSIKLNAPDEAKTFLPHYENVKEKRHAGGTFLDLGQENDKLYRVNEDGILSPVERCLRSNAERTRVWYGSIGSGEKCMKNAQKSEKLRDMYDLIGLEMEAAGVMNRIPVGVIRGVCDYGDEFKNKEWQPYAAMMAAAYAKAIMCEILPREILPIIPAPVKNAKILDQFLSDLCETDPYNEMLRIREDKGGLLEQCYHWILPQFQKWKTNQNDRLVWIKGDPGKGKTMLMIGLLEVLTSQLINSEAITYFFCQSSVSHLNNPLSVLRGLIWKLLWKHHDLAQYIPEEYVCKGHERGKEIFKGPNSFSILTRMLSAMLNNSSLETIYILIDGLDECSADSIQLFEWISNDKSKAKWVVSSCHTPDIEGIFRPFAGSQRQKLNLESNETNVSEAVNLFIEHKMEVLAQRRSYGAELRATIERQLKIKSESTFLWVSLVCKRLEKVPRRKAEAEVEAFPSGLEPLYGRMLQQIEDQEDDEDGELCRKILRTMAAAYRSLVLEELMSISGLPEYPKEDIRDLVELCGSFLIFREDIISFIHKTARDYMVNGQGKRIFPGEIVEEHRMILSRSIEVLSDSLRRDIYNLGDPAYPTAEVKHPDPNPLTRLRYPCSHWVSHLKYLDTNSSSEAAIWDPKALQAFLKRHFLHWLEALTLLGALSDGIIMIIQLENIFKSEHTQLYDFACDARRLVLKNRSIIASHHLQLYGSVLLFSPEKSIIRKTFEEHTKWATVTSGRAQDWSSTRQILEGHSNVVECVAFSPDGTKIASCSQDKTIRIWDIMTGQPECILHGHSRIVYSIVFYAGGAKLASASMDDTIRLWNVAIGEIERILEKPIPADPSRRPRREAWGIQSISLCPDETKLASGGGASVFLWDIATGDAESISNEMSPIECVAFNPSGTKLMTAGAELLLWDVAGRYIERRFESHPSPFHFLHVAFSPDGSKIATASDKSVQLWNVGTGGVEHKLEGHSNTVYSVAFSPNGYQLASASYDRTVRVWDTRTPGEADHIQRHSGYVFGVAFSPDGCELASGSEHGTVRIWDATAKQDDAMAKIDPEGICCTTFTPDGSMLVSGYYDGILRFWSPTSGRLLRELNHLHREGAVNEFKSQAICMLRFAHDGSKLASGSREMINIWDTANWKIGMTLNICGHVMESQFSMDGTRIVTCSREQKIQIWNLGTGELLHMLESPVTSDIQFSPDGSKLVAFENLIETELPTPKDTSLVLDQAEVRIWNAATGGIHRVHLIENWIKNMAFSPGGARILLESWDDHLLVQDEQSGNIERNFPDFFGDIRAVRFMSDGNELELERPSKGETKVMSSYPLYSVAGNGCWICKDRVRLLYLPVDYQSKPVVVDRNSVAIIPSDAPIIFMEFSPDKFTKNGVYATQ